MDQPKKESFRALIDGRLAEIEKTLVEGVGGCLRKFFPNAATDEWRLVTAGQGVQIVERVPKQGGVLQFGTETVTAKDGSIAALLGASPGASTPVDVMLQVLEKRSARLPVWRSKLQQMVPAYCHSLADDPAFYRKLFDETEAKLHRDREY